MAAVLVRRNRYYHELEQQLLKETRKQERLEWTQKLAQRSQRLQQDPAYRRKMELLAQQKLEDEREAAFLYLSDYWLRNLFGHLPLPCLRCHKRFWEWRKGAKEQLKELRESERIDMARRAKGGSLSWGMGWFWCR